VGTLSADHLRHVWPLGMVVARRSLLGAASAIAVVCAFVATTLPARAQSWDSYWYEVRPKPRPKPKPRIISSAPAERPNKEPFGQIPKGPLQIVISIDEQKLHLYSDGTDVAETLVATGVPAHPTPMGVFSVIQKELLHHSNIYSGAPMPYMQRITWSGVALHEGVNLGHPASHGCIRMSHDFATRLWVLTRLGARVIIARPQLRPEDFADARLFVHKEISAPVPSAAAPETAKPIKTAQTIDDGKTSDAPAVKPDPGAANAQNVRAKDLAKNAAKGAADPSPSPNTDSGAAGMTLRGTSVAGTETVDAGYPPVPVVPASGVLQPDKAIQTDTPAGTIAPADPATATPPSVPVPPAKPAEIARNTPQTPISIFVSGKEKKVYVRQDFLPLFSAPITIADSDRPLGTHVFTALNYLDDHSTFRWNVISLPAEPPKAPRTQIVRTRIVRGKRYDEVVAPPPTPSPLSPQEALAHIGIPPDVIERISQLIIPGSSLMISDQGLGPETGAGTDFIVVTR
jgi:L,D-transpeptidase-like protein